MNEQPQRADPIPTLPRPRNRAELRSMLRKKLDIRIPDKPMIEGHQSPFDYLAHTFFEPRKAKRTNKDAIVWAARGSGKTFTAALATALDLVFKPGIEVRLLAGSLEQGSRMHAHLRSLFTLEPFAAQLASIPRPITDRKVQLANGSVATLSAASHASVRGSRPQKLRIDEADVLTHDIYSAAQLTTRSKLIGNTLVSGAIDTLSTWHQPGGPMSTLIDPVSLSPSGGRTLFRFSAIDVLTKCPTKRDCLACQLESDCKGAAKQARGHLPIDDAITMKQRTGALDWSTEMLCNRPARTNAVFPEFDALKHVESQPPISDPPSATIAGMDFGFRSPTVLLIAHTYHHESPPWVFVTHEWIERSLRLDCFIDALIDPSRRFANADPPPPPTWIGVDPAGNQRHEQTGTSNVQLMKRAGLDVRFRRSSILESLKLVRKRLAPAAGSPTLLIHPRCSGLIHALTHYHYPEHDPQSTTPVKDGYDHAVDALRYMLLNLDARHKATFHRYA